MLRSLVLAGALLLAVTTVAQATAPTCNDMNVSVPHNAATPIFVECTGGTGAGSPDVLIATSPSKGTLSPGAGQTSTDQWVVYTPNPGASGADSFMYRGISPGSGSGGADEVGPLRTVNLRIGAGSAAGVREPVTERAAKRRDAHGAHEPAARLCVGRRSDHELQHLERARPRLARHREPQQRTGRLHLERRLLGARQLRIPGDEHVRRRQLPVRRGHLQPDRARSSAGADGQPRARRGATGRHGPAGRRARRARPGATGDGRDGRHRRDAAPRARPGSAGQDGAPGTVVTRDRLFVASFLDALKVRRGQAVALRYVATTPCGRLMLEVRKGTRRVAVISGRARAGLNTIRWNGRSGRAAAPAGSYRLAADRDRRRAGRPRPRRGARGLTVTPRATRASPPGPRAPARPAGPTTPAS